MTKQEAIDYIKENCYGDWCEDEWREVHDMAIEALSCSEKPNRSDTIYRQDIYDLLDNWDEPMISRSAFRCDVEDLPSAQPDISDDGTLMMTVPNGMLNDVKRVLVDEVGTKFCKVMYQDDPERKKGHWIKISPSCIYECSVCGQNVMTADIDAYRFCHGCGADMITEPKRVWNGNTMYFQDEDKQGWTGYGV